MNKQLSFHDHSRHFNQCVYVYPVVSRRAQGVSLGINLNINNACNWRCIYCQVEGLQRGKPERINLEQLATELDLMLNWIINGDFLIKYAPDGLQRFNDICLSGNGESTLSEDFLAVCELIALKRKQFSLDCTAVKTILISNGSEFHRSKVQQGVEIIARLNGEVWFKIDRATSSGINQVNQVQLDLVGIKKRLAQVSQLCPTYIQSCWFNYASQEPSTLEQNAFIHLIGEIKPLIQGVLLYSTARNPALVEGELISQVSAKFLANLAQSIHELGIVVKYFI